MAAFAAAVRELFPGCPPGEEERVARYACRRGSSRVGQVAVINGYFGEAVELAVVAHLRHRFSRYEEHLGRGCSRDEARARMGERFVEVHVRASVDECERRDVKGLYERARAGQIQAFTGVSDPYEEPQAAELTLE